MWLEVPFFGIRLDVRSTKRKPLPETRKGDLDAILTNLPTDTDYAILMVSVAAIAALSG